MYEFLKPLRKVRYGLKLIVNKRMKSGGTETETSTAATKSRTPMVRARDQCEMPEIRKRMRYMAVTRQDTFTAASPEDSEET